MKKIFLLILITTAFSFMATAQTKITLSVGAKSMTATLADNQATREFKELLDKGSVTIQMNDYGGFEKVGTLPQSFTTSNSQITTEPGEIMLYQGNNMVIFYGSNSWSYTRLGKIDGATADNVKQFLGDGSISLTLSLDSSAGIDDVAADGGREETIYDISGNRVTKKPLASGVYIINGKKTLITN